MARSTRTDAAGSDWDRSEIDALKSGDIRRFSALLKRVADVLISLGYESDGRSIEMIGTELQLRSTLEVHKRAETGTVH